MITHKIYHSLIAALIGAATTGAVQAAPIPAMGLRFVAAEAGDSSISVRSARVLPHERSMIVSMCIRVDRDLKGTESIELRPVLTDSTGHSAVLPSIFINGRTQHIAFQRDRRNAKRDLVTLRRRNGMEQTIDYLREVAYQPWMRKATLVLEEVACGCGIPIAYDSHAVATLRSDDTPRLAFRIPEVEEVKTRQESGRAFLAFQLGKSEILDNFRSNATELAKIMQAIDLVRNDSNVTVSHIAIHGYASPDGSLALNERLSAERTQALKSWVMSKYQFDETLFTTAHTAEDWEGLVNFLRNNNTLEGREEILNIIATVGDLDKREARIREEFPSQYRSLHARQLVSLPAPLRLYRRLHRTPVHRRGGKEGTEVAPAKPQYRRNVPHRTNLQGGKRGVQRGVPHRREAESGPPRGQSQCGLHCPQGG